MQRTNARMRQTGEYQCRRNERVKSQSEKLARFRPNRKGYFDSSIALDLLLQTAWGKKS